MVSRLDTQTKTQKERERETRFQYSTYDTSLRSRLSAVELSTQLEVDEAR